MADTNISMVRGDTLAFGVEFVDLDQDIETAFFSCRRSHEEDLLFQKSLEDGITKVDETHYTVRVAPEDTRNLDAGKYYYDFEVGLNGDIFTILKGVLEIEQDVTF